MKQYFLDNNSNHLIVFFCGWGMDETPFSVLNTKSDVLFLYDYADLNLEFDFSKYEKKTLLAFSYGVYVCGLVNDRLPDFDEKIALNGTLIPVDDEYGVPLKKFLLSAKMESDTIVKFRERLFYNKEDLSLFNENLPQRSAESCTNELEAIKKYFTTLQLPEMSFDKVIVSSFDRVIPTKNQLNFWKNKSACNTIEIADGHFPFYSFKNLEEIC